MARIIDDEAGIAEVVRGMKRVAVLGIKTEQQGGEPSFTVPEYLADAGIEIVPVPVYYPEVTQILGKPVFRKLVDIPGDVDLVDVFRRPKDVAGHLEDMLSKKPKVVWMQLGISNDEVAQKLVAAGIDVVQNRCLLVDHQRYAKRR
jgi:predicted CoA-binding protein